VPFCGSMGLGQSQHQVMERVLSYSISGNVALILSLCGDSVVMFCFIVLWCVAETWFLMFRDTWCLHSQVQSE